jgi:hypothetical protein
VAKQWPNLSKLKHPVLRDSNILFITVKTQMFCGTEIEQHTEAPTNKEFNTKDRLSNAVNSMGNKHIRSCEKCSKHYGR